MENNNKSSRPSSYYDNLTGGIPVIPLRNNVANSSPSSLNYSILNGGSVISARSTIPSQTHLLNTTVPQNMAFAPDLATRHTPTRNSLRHSRMIVMTRTLPNNSVRRNKSKSMPKSMKNQRLMKTLVSVETILASALCFLAMWLFIWAPNLKIRDNPYWSAIPLLLSGIISLILLCCCNTNINNGLLNKTYPYILTRTLSIILTVISGAVCLIAGVFAIVHLVSLSSMVCTPAHQTNSTCFCKLSSDLKNETNPFLLIKSYHYIDLTCPEVNQVLIVLMITSCVLNVSGGIISIWCVYLYWSGKYLYNYSKVKTKKIKKHIVLTNTAS